MSILQRKAGVTIYKQEKACDGYTLIDPFKTNDVWLIDMRGNYVHRWIMPSLPRDHGVLLPDGHLLYATAGPLPVASEDMSIPRVATWGVGAGIVEVDWGGKLVWKYVDKCQTHDFCRMENGNTMIPVYMPIPEEMIPKVKGGIPGTEDRGMIWADGFREVTPDSKVVWEWAAADHLDPEVHVMCPLAYRGDWTHLNTCEDSPAVTF